MLVSRYTTVQAQWDSHTLGRNGEIKGRWEGKNWTCKIFGSCLALTYKQEKYLRSHWYPCLSLWIKVHFLTVVTLQKMQIPFDWACFKKTFTFLAKPGMHYAGSFPAIGLFVDSLSTTLNENLPLLLISVLRCQEIPSFISFPLGKGRRWNAAPEPSVDVTASRGNREDNVTMAWVWPLAHLEALAQILQPPFWSKSERFFCYSGRWVFLWLKRGRKLVFQVCCCVLVLLCNASVDNDLYCLCHYSVEQKMKQLRLLDWLTSNVNLALQALHSLKTWHKMILFFWNSGHI